MSFLHTHTHTHTHTFLIVLGAGSLRSGCQSGQAVVRVFFLVADCRLLAMFSWGSWTIKKAVCVLSHFSCVWLFAALCSVAHQAPLFKRFSRQEHWSGLPFPSPEALPDPGIKPTSLYVSYIDVLKNWCFRIVVLGKTLESPLKSKEIKPVNPKGN